MLVLAGCWGGIDSWDGHVFFLVGWEDLVGSSGVEAFSARAGASVDVGWLSWQCRLTTCLL